MKRRFNLLEHPPNVRQRLIFFGSLIIVWGFVTHFSLVNSLLLPSPLAVIEAAGNIGLALVGHSMATVGRALLGLLIGTVIGVFLGLLVRYNTIAKVMTEPFLDAARPVPVIALIPFFILIFGFSEIGRILLVLIAVTIIIAVATVEAIETMPEAWFRFPLVAGYSRKRIFMRVILPGLTPWLVGPIRIALSISFTLVIASEFMGAQAGLGYLINAARVNLATPTILLCILLLGILAQVLDSILYYLMSKLNFWYQGSRKVLHFKGGKL